MKKTAFLFLALSLVMVGCSDEKKVSDQPKKETKVEEKEEPVKDEPVEEEPAPAETEEPVEEEDNTVIATDTDFGLTQTSLLSAVTGIIEQYGMPFIAEVFSEDEESFSIALTNDLILVGQLNSSGLVNQLTLAGDKKNKDEIMIGIGLLFRLCSPNLDQENRGTMLDKLEFERIAEEPIKTSSTNQVTFEHTVYRITTLPEGTMMVDASHRSLVEE